MIRVTYVQGNGYKCSCCRQENNEIVDFNSRQEAVAWLTQLEVTKQVPVKSDMGGRFASYLTDRTVVDIREISDDLSNEIVADKAIVEEIVANAKAEQAREQEENRRKSEEQWKILGPAIAKAFCSQDNMT